MDQEELTALVVGLLATKREDDWWDFKQEHQHDKAELVHDIICMANNMECRDAYIIIGIDEEKECSIHEGILILFLVWRIKRCK